MTATVAPLVFIVDDDPSVRKSLARLAKTAGYEVEVFASAREFLARPQQDRPRRLGGELAPSGRRSSQGRGRPPGTGAAG
jgi:hypothetical protein